MRTIRALAFVTLATMGVLLILGAPAQATTVSFSVFTDPHTNPGISGGTIGFSFAGDMFVGSVQRDGQNVLYATDLTVEILTSLLRSFPFPPTRPPSTSSPVPLALADSHFVISTSRPLTILCTLATTVPVRTRS